MCRSVPQIALEVTRTTTSSGSSSTASGTSWAMTERVPAKTTALMPPPPPMGEIICTPTAASRQLSAAGGSGGIAAWMGATVIGGSGGLQHGAAEGMGSSWRDQWFDHPRHGPLPALLLVLTVATGVVDAVSILAL